MRAQTPAVAPDATRSLPHKATSSPGPNASPRVVPQSLRVRCCAGMPGGTPWRPGCTSCSVWTHQTMFRLCRAGCRTPASASCTWLSGTRCSPTTRRGPESPHPECCLHPRMPGCMHTGPAEAPSKVAVQAVGRCALAAVCHHRVPVPWALHEHAERSQPQPQPAPRTRRFLRT